MSSVNYKILSTDPNISIFAVNKHIKESLAFITEHSNIVFKDQKNSGNFGFVFDAETPEFNAVAVKVVAEDDVGEFELLWKSFSNQHVLALLETHFFPQINTRVFVMARAENTLKVLIEGEEFRKRSDSLDVVASWIDNVVSGAQYLHSKGLAHCSLKTKNVLIMEDKRAVLCHFHNLAPVNSFVKCEEVDMMFRPPECFRNGIDRRPIARSLDIYSIGLLVIEAITGDSLGLKLPSTVTSWSTDIYPVIFKILSNLKKMSKNKYPNAIERDLNPARNFVCSCLRLNTEKRVNATQLWKHKYVGGAELYPEEKIWQYKGNIKQLRKRVKNMTIFQEVDHLTVIHESMPFHSKANDNKENSQTTDQNAESNDTDIGSNINFSAELSNKVEKKPLDKEERVSLKQEFSLMQGEPIECFDIESELSILSTKESHCFIGHSDYENRDIDNMYQNVNHEAGEENFYKEKERGKSEVEIFMHSEDMDFYNIRDNENTQSNKKLYVNCEDQDLRDFSSEIDGPESGIFEKVFKSCSNVSLCKLMNYILTDSLTYRVSHPDNFLNKLSTRLTHDARKSDVTKKIEKVTNCESIVNEDSSKVEMETGIFSDKLKMLPLKIFDSLLTHM